MGLIDTFKKGYGKLDKAHKDYQRWTTESKARNILNLRKLRIKEEGDARLRVIKKKEIKRIRKARSTAQIKRPNMMGDMFGFSETKKSSKKDDDKFIKEMFGG